MKISAILDKIDEKQLFVPAFQREYVWKRDDAKQLMDSLVKEYPTGTMLLWETSSPPELKGPHKYNENQGAVRILLDGQQRVTTLYLLIRGEVPSYYTAAEIEHDTRGLHVNLETLELQYYSKLRMQNDPFWQDITRVIQGKVSAFDLQAQFAAIDRELGMDELKTLNDNINAVTLIKEREFPEQTIPVKASIREAIDIFYKVNASGVSLTEAELALAQISGYWPQARDLFKAKLAALADEGFSFKLDWLMYVLLGCLHHGASDMRKLHGEENDVALRSAWGRLESQTLDYVVNLLRTNAYVDHSHEINSPYTIVPIVVHCFDKEGEHLTDAEIRKVVKWFYYAQIRARYSSQLAQKLDRDLRTLVESAQPFDDLLKVIEEESGRLEVMPYEFEGRATQHPLFSMVRWYLKSRGAVCLTTGMGLHHNMGKKYQLELDHIFPFSRLKSAGYGQQNRVKYALAQELTNRAILTQIANRSKSDTEAADYLAGVSKKFPKALELQCIPTDPALWQTEQYEAFLAARRKLLADHLNEFLSGITDTEEGIAPVTLEQRVADGESDELEFKGSLRWDLNEQVVNKKLEEVVCKTAAAFGNTQGGTLLIGVMDDGEVIGLEHDYSSLGGVDADKYQLHIRNLLTQQFGGGFVASKVQISFPELHGEEICQLDILPADEPVILTTQDKNGVSTQRFHVRSGNSSPELPLAELNSYWATRFAK